MRTALPLDGSTARRGSLTVPAPLPERPRESRTAAERRYTPCMSAPRRSYRIAEIHKAMSLLRSASFLRPSKRPKSRPRRTFSSPAPAAEVLETRALLSAVASWQDPDGAVRVLGTSANDVVALTGSAASLTVKASTGGVSAPPKTFANVTRVYFSGWLGDDYFENLTNVPVTGYGDAGNDRLLGGGGNDAFVGGDGNDTISGKAGVDWIYGLAGNDGLAGGDGADVIYGNTGVDWIYGQNGNDSLIGDSDPDVIYGGEGHDGIAGLGGDDRLIGGDQSFGSPGYFDNDTIYGGDGNDVVVGATGDDLIFGEAGHDWIDGGDSDLYDLNGLYGGDGNDFIRGGHRIYGGAGDDVLWGNQWLDDVIYGGTGNDILVGDPPPGPGGVIKLDGGSDTLYGEEGHDVLLGGPGSDTMIGGAGIDRFTDPSVRDLPEVLRDRWRNEYDGSVYGWYDVTDEEGPEDENEYDF